MAHREYSEEIKADVLAALLAGQLMSEVVREYGVPRTTIIGWQRRQAEQIPKASGNVFLDVDPVATIKKTKLIPDLVLDLMIARLESQIALAQHCADKQWLQSQSADSLAILLGVQDDKLYRMLEALERARSRHSLAESE